MSRLCQEHLALDSSFRALRCRSKFNLQLCSKTRPQFLSFCQTLVMPLASTYAFISQYKTTSSRPIKFWFLSEVRPYNSKCANCLTSKLDLYYASGLSWPNRLNVNTFNITPNSAPPHQSNGTTPEAIHTHSDAEHGRQNAYFYNQYSFRITRTLPC